MELFNVDYDTIESKLLVYMETNEDLLTRTQVRINFLETSLARYRFKYYEAAGFPVRRYNSPC